MKRPAFRLPTGRSFAFAALLDVATPSATLHAQLPTYYWDGAGANANLGTATNWQGNVAPSNNGSANVFND